VGKNLISQIQRQIKGTMNSLTKALLVLALIGGAALGFGVEYFLTNQRLESLEQDLNITRGQFTGLQEDYDALSEDFDDLDSRYNELEETTVSSDAYDGLMKNFSELEVENIDLNEELSLLRDELAELDHSYEGLKMVYTDLLEEFRQYVLPKSKKETIKGLEITVSLDKIQYDKQDDNLTGVVSISHPDGSPFEGNITFSVKYEFLELGTGVGFRHEIFGSTGFSLSDVFTLAGRYSVGLLEVFDESGTKIATWNDLKDFRLQFDVL
jgi:predicted nuclease with TOPRIM domain